MKRNIPPSARRVLDTIMRNIYGYNGRKSVDMSISFISSATNMNRGNVNRATRFLLANNMIKRELGDPQKPSRYSIQKNYDEWAIKPDGESAQTLPMGRVSSDSGVESAHTEEVESVHTEKVESVQPPKKTKNKKQFARARASNIICTQDQPISQPAFPHDCYSPQSVKIEIEILRNIGLKNPEIKNHLIMRGIAEAIVDKALGKDF